jgi:hypothetical protein
MAAEKLNFIGYMHRCHAQETRTTATESRGGICEDICDTDGY